MKLTKFSRDRMMLSATRWTVPRDFFEPLYNYLVHGFEPGSFWSAVLANDFMRAVQHSHPSNDIPALKNTVGWILDSWPKAAYGDYSTIQTWIAFSGHERRLYLEQHNLIYSEQEEIMMALQGKKSYEPMMW
jgi:hypothetical protein